MRKEAFPRYRDYLTSLNSSNVFPCKSFSYSDDKRHVPCQP